MWGSRPWVLGRRAGWTASWWSLALVGVLGAEALGRPASLATVDHVAGPVVAAPVARVAVVPVPEGTATPGADGHAGLVVAAIVGAVVLVAFWRVLVQLVIVALVALGLIGLLVVIAPVVAHADTVTPPPSAGSGSLPLIAVLVLVAAVFAVGLLLGEQWHRHQLARRERQLAEARRQLTALTRGYRDRAGPD